ncbi:FAD:protein FMN transferase [Ideonella sp. A 288]|uniref:FAD:protein FMN transferase n=1 Tax=Ideonella sp. A 288 TaxID=1962181 RepID=UPI000B4B8391|nr:FAD:protein FMN transferase [Ideonella sp. A 288]
MHVFRHAFAAMASPCEVVLAADGPVQARALAQQAEAEVRRIECAYSRYRPDSIVSRLNAAAGGAPVECDDETLALLDYADTLHAASDGLFDITSGVLRRAWNFRQPRVPDSAELDALCRLVGWARVERNGRLVRLPQAGMEIDFGGIGKEYAADRAGALLAGQGVRHGYVNLAGDMHVIGPKPDGAAWMIGIQHPREPGELVATLPVQRGGLATSGDYERYFELDSRRYCHILDPRSGLPVTHWRSISVLAPLAVVAGNCATIGMLLQERALDFLDASGTQYLAIDQQGEVHLRAAEPAVAPA